MLVFINHNSHHMLGVQHCRKKRVNSLYESIVDKEFTERSISFREAIDQCGHQSTEAGMC